MNTKGPDDPSASRILRDCDAIIFDIDGTITDEKMRIPMEVVERLLMLSRDHVVALVTSRGLAEMEECRSDFAKALGLVPGASPERVYFFTASGAEAFRFDLGFSTHLYKIESDGFRTMKEAVATLLAENGWRRVTRREPWKSKKYNEFSVLDRGSQLTLFFSNVKQMRLCCTQLASHPGIRLMPVAHGCVHIVSEGVGKNTAVDYLRKTAGVRDAMAFADGFHELENGAIRGNDCDFIGKGTICVQVAAQAQLHRDVLYFPLDVVAYRSTLQVLDLLSTHTAHELRVMSDKHRLAAATQMLDETMAACGLSPSLSGFIRQVVRSVERDIDGDIFCANITEAAELLRAGPPDKHFDAIGRLLRGVDQDVRLSPKFFGGNAAILARWMWDEQQLRPGLSVTNQRRRLRLMQQRSSMLPEEIALYLLPVMRVASGGSDLFFIGRDAESLLPVAADLVAQLFTSGVLKRRPQIFAEKISARKGKNASGQVENRDHVSRIGSLERQFRALLSPAEAESTLSSQEVLEIEQAALLLPKSVRVALDGHVGSKGLGALIRSGTRDELLTALADAEIDERVVKYGALAASLFKLVEIGEHPDARKGVLIEELQGRFSGAVWAELQPLVASCVKSGASLDRAAFGNVVRALITRLETMFKEIRGTLVVPFAPILSIVLRRTAFGALLNRDLCFVDGGVGTGMTVLFVELLRKAVGATSKWAFCALYAIPNSPATTAIDSLSTGHIQAINEGDPSQFDFYYDDNDRRVYYRDGLVVGQTEVGSHYEEELRAFAEVVRPLFERHPVLERSGIPLGAVVRWWLRRDKIWSMRVLNELARADDKASLIKLQSAAIAMFDELDTTVAASQRDRLMALDLEARPVETSNLLRSWLSRYESYVARAGSGARVAASLDVAALRQYLAGEAELDTLLTDYYMALPSGALAGA